MVYCQDISGLISPLGIVYIPTEWRLFLDSSVKSLKAMLLHNGNKIGSVPVGSFSRKICDVLKLISVVLGLQAGYTKHPCFLCMWNSRAVDCHYTQTS